MAKYIVNYGKTGPRMVNCAILDENFLSESYTVQFDNGVIKDVDKKRVKNLDHIDEAVLDRLKSAGTKLVDKAVTGAKLLYNNVKKFIVRLFSPVRTLSDAATKIEGLSFYPSPNAVELGKTYGFSVKEVTDTTPEDEEFLEDANNFLEKYIAAYEDGDTRAINKLLAESKRAERIFRKHLCEGVEDQSLEHKSWPNVGTDYIVNALEEQYDIVKEGEAFTGESSKITVPYCIWGAPGVGKTQIIKSVIKELREIGIPANIIEINAMAMRKDDFSLPGKVTVNQAVKTKDGRIETYSSDKAAELSKTWLPAWDPADIDESKGITAEVLDDIKNGGDGTGNGVGGFIFIDELSRIDGAVLNVLMTLVQNRQFNGLRLGSKWMFVAAANRPSDLGRFKSKLFWDEAMTGRFQHVNFVPTFKEWKKWATAVDEESGQPHIFPQFVEFLTEHQDAWYNISMRNKEDDEDIVSSTLHPGPRGWEIASKDVYTKMRARNKALADPENSILAKLAKKNGTKLKSPRLTPEEISMSLRKSVGNDAAELYKSWAGFDNLFTAAIAKDVWKHGDAVDIPFIPNDITIGAAIDKIFVNHPNIKKGSKEKVNITPEELTNVVNYLIKCAENMDTTNSGAINPVLTTINVKIKNKIMHAPYYVDLISSEKITGRKNDIELFKPVFDIIERKMNNNIDNM